MATFNNKELQEIIKEGALTLVEKKKHMQALNDDLVQIDEYINTFPVKKNHEISCGGWGCLKIDYHGGKRMKRVFIREYETDTYKPLNDCHYELKKMGAEYLPQFIKEISQP